MPPTGEVVTAFKYFGHQSINTGVIKIEDLISIIAECGSLKLSEAKTKNMLDLIVKVDTDEDNNNINWNQFVELNKN